MKRSVTLAGDTFQVNCDPWSPGHGVPEPEAFVSVNGSGMLVPEPELTRMIQALTTIREFMREQGRRATKATSRRPAPPR
jgi:hypothetical protein